MKEVEVCSPIGLFDDENNKNDTDEEDDSDNNEIDNEVVCL